MAIGTDDRIAKFGTLDALGTTTSAVIDDAFSDGTNDLLAWTNDDDALEAAFCLEFTTATTGAAGSIINLYAALQNIGDAGTEDAEVPDANFPHTFIGQFYHNNPSTTAQAANMIAFLPNQMTSQIYHFYIEDKTGEDISASWELSVTPLAEGPAA